MFTGCALTHTYSLDLTSICPRDSLERVYFSIGASLHCLVYLPRVIPFIGAPITPITFTPLSEGQLFCSPEHPLPLFTSIPSAFIDHCPYCLSSFSLDHPISLWSPIAPDVASSPYLCSFSYSSRALSFPVGCALYTILC